MPGQMLPPTSVSYTHLDVYKRQEQERRQERVAKGVQDAAKPEKPADVGGAHDFTPVEYDPQYILMVNDLKKYFPRCV